MWREIYETVRDFVAICLFAAFILMCAAIYIGLDNCIIRTSYC